MEQFQGRSSSRTERRSVTSLTRAKNTSRSRQRLSIPIHHVCDLIFFSHSISNPFRVLSGDASMTVRILLRSVLVLRPFDFGAISFTRSVSCYVYWCFLYYWLWNGRSIFSRDLRYVRSIPPWFPAMFNPCYWFLAVNNSKCVLCSWYLLWSVFSCSLEWTCWSKYVYSLEWTCLSEHVCSQKCTCWSGYGIISLLLSLSVFFDPCYVLDLNCVHFFLLCSSINFNMYILFSSYVCY